MKKLWVVAGLLIPLTAGAEMHKCVMPNGKIIYSDLACPSTGKSSTIQANFSVYKSLAPVETGNGGTDKTIRELSRRIQDSNQSNYERSVAISTLRALNKIPPTLRNSPEVKNALEKAMEQIGPNYNRSVAVSYLEAMGSSTQANETPSAPNNSLPSPSVITNCDQSGCNDNMGNRYNRGGGNTFFGPNGACQKIGNQMQCP